MNGKNHLITGACIGADLCLAYASSSLLQQAGPYLDPVSRYGPIWGVPAAAGCAMLYLLGCILPDIDNGGIVTKMLHFQLVVRHRGFAHSVWLMVPFLAAALFAPGMWALRFLCIGMLAHCLVDKFSTAGWVPFYPFGRWRVVRNVVVQKRRHVSLYGSDRPGAETAVCAAIVLASVLWWAFWAYLTFWNAGA